MKVALVVAPILIKRCPLIGLGYVASYLRERGHEVRVLDLNTRAELPHAEDERRWFDPVFVSTFFETNPALVDGWVDEILSWEPDAAGFSTWACNAAATQLLAKRIRARGPRPWIVLGGPQAGFEAGALMGRDFVDAVIPGEGEASLASWVEASGEAGRPVPAAGALVRTAAGVEDGGPRPEIEDLDTLPFPDFSLFRLDGYFMRGTLPLSFNRGCLRRCVFCNIYESWKTYRHRKAENIFLELKWQLERHPEVRHFEIDVSALNLDLRELERLCDLVIAEGLRVTWGGSAVFRPGMDGALLKKMARAGLNRLDFGFESGSPKVLRLMRKGYLVEHAEETLRACREAGVETILNIIVGFPGETEEDYGRTKDFLLRNRDCYSKVGPPSELWIGNNNYLQKHPDRFDVELHPDRGDLWRSLDGSSDHERRAARVRDFERWTREQGIPTSTFAEARKEHETV